MTASGVFISCDVMLLDLFSEVWILILGGGEENIKILLKKKISDVFLEIKLKDHTHGITKKKFTCRWEIALNMMRLFSQSMVLRASSAEGMKPIESSKVILLFQNYFQ